MRVVPEGRIYHKHITGLKLCAYEFTLYNAEELCESIAEFSHSHHAYQIYYVLESHIGIRVQDADLTLSKGEFILLAKDTLHCVAYRPDRETSYFSMIFDISPLTDSEGDSELLDIMAVLSRLKDYSYIRSPLAFDGRPILDQILSEQTGKEAGWNTCMVFYYYRFFIEAIRNISSAKARAQTPSGKLNLGIEASKFIHKHFGEDITLKDAAEYLNVSPRHVNRAFQDMFGTTFVKTLNRLRIEYTKGFVGTTNYSVKQISELVGFSSSRRLFKLFKEYEGMSISRYREQHKPKPRD
jgi:AraC-like DNA-binding protein